MSLGEEVRLEVMETIVLLEVRIYKKVDYL